jgi:hypothetical protein
MDRIRCRSKSLASLTAPKWSYIDGSKKPGAASHLAMELVYTDERWSNARRRKVGASYLVLVWRIPAIVLKGARAGGGRKNLGDYRSINGQVDKKDCSRTLHRAWPSRGRICPPQSLQPDVRQANYRCHILAVRSWGSRNTEDAAVSMPA